MAAVEGIEAQWKLQGCRQFWGEGVALNGSARSVQFYRVRCRWSRGALTDTPLARFQRKSKSLVQVDALRVGRAAKRGLAQEYEPVLVTNDRPRSGEKRILPANGNRNLAAARPFLTRSCVSLVAARSTLP